MSHVPEDARRQTAEEIQLQQPFSAWTGGQGTEPYEQNTQQSPAFGRKNALQRVHSWKYTHASWGIVSIETCPHSGHVSSHATTAATGPARMLIAETPTPAFRQWFDALRAQRHRYPEMERSCCPRDPRVDA
jgi:hypothetical protein